MLHLGYGIFKELNSKVVQSAAFVIRNSKCTQNHLGVFVRLIDFQGDGERSRVKSLEAIANPDCGYLYYAKAADFAKIPGSAIAYWVKKNMREAFSNSLLHEQYIPKAGMSTTDNDQFLRRYWEVGLQDIGFDYCDSNDAAQSGKRWFPFNKGGGFRRWYGNNEYIVNWGNNGESIRNFLEMNPHKNVGGRIVNEDCFFIACITWGDVQGNRI